MIVVLVDEGTLGQIVALPAPHNHIPQGRNRPLPNTAAVKQWFRDLVRTHCRTIGAELEPQATPNPPLAENVMIFHQLKVDEVQAVLSVLEVRTAWSAELLRRGLSAGHLFSLVSGGGGSGGLVVYGSGVPPFIAL